MLRHALTVTCLDLPCDDQDFVDEDARTLRTLPEPFLQYDSAMMVDQFLQGLNISTDWAIFMQQNRTCVESGVCATGQEDESITAWGERMGLPLYAAALVATINGLAAGPAADYAARNVLVSDVATTNVAYYLRSLGMTAAKLPKGFRRRNLLSLLASDAKRWYWFEGGYQQFWKDLAAKLPAKVKLSTTVFGCAAPVHIPSNEDPHN